MWALWCKSFGPKCSQDAREADVCCWCRTLRWFFAAFFVGLVIVAGNIRHW